MAKSARQLQQGQRVAVRLGQDLVLDPRIELESDHRPQQRPGLLVRQPPYLQVRKPPELLARLARGEDQPHRLGQQPPAPRTPAPALRPGPATAHHRPRTAVAGLLPPPPARSAPPPRPGTGPAQLLRAARTLSPGRPAAEPEAAPAGPAAACTANAARRTPAPSPFRPRRPGHPHVRCRPAQVVQQRRLAHPRLTAHHQRPPAPRPQIPQQAIEYRALAGGPTAPTSAE